MIRNPDTKNEDREPGITNGIAKQLRNSQPWVYLLALTGLLFSLIRLAGLMSLFRYSAIFGSILVITALLQLLGAIILFKYGRNITTILKTGSAHDLTTGLAILSKLWMVMGLEIIISLIGMVSRLIM